MTMAGTLSGQRLRAELTTAFQLRVPDGPAADDKPQRTLSQACHGAHSHRLATARTAAGVPPSAQPQACHCALNP